MIYDPDNDIEDDPAEYHGAIIYARRKHDENPERYHTRARVQTRINNGLRPCHFCEPETVEIPTLSKGDENG